MTSASGVFAMTTFIGRDNNHSAEATLVRAGDFLSA
jgi:hypothetical protein